MALLYPLQILLRGAKAWIDAQRGLEFGSGFRFAPLFFQNQTQQPVRVGRVGFFPFRSLGQVFARIVFSPLELDPRFEDSIRRFIIRGGIVGDLAFRARERTLEFMPTLLQGPDRGQDGITLGPRGIELDRLPRMLTCLLYLPVGGLEVKSRQRRLRFVVLRSGFDRFKQPLLLLAGILCRFRQFGLRQVTAYGLICSMAVAMACALPLSPPITPGA